VIALDCGAEAAVKWRKSLRGMLAVPLHDLLSLREEAVLGRRLKWKPFELASPLRVLPTK
jgi:hypothetical protein